MNSTTYQFIASAIKVWPLSLYYVYANSILSDRMLERFHDTEEKVRLQAVVSVCEAAAERIYTISDEVLHCILFGFVSLLLCFLWFLLVANATIL